MFSSEEQLKKRTPKEGIDRREFISLLVDEYYENISGNLEAQQQVTANLANFAYDPINWGYLKQAKAHELFVEILSEAYDTQLLNHAAAGICNICLDPQIKDYFLQSGLPKHLSLLVIKHKNNHGLIGHVLTTLILLNQNLIEDKEFLKTLEGLRTSEHKICSNLATVLLEDNAAHQRASQQQDCNR
ncbi:armadillo repeat-containing protein 7-like [Uranotaenia lowii]|uniref:armadillo repeat-containing protein 7-like n=1 Tax=Uranotaenia lowii TaxID=190385 RepID=UPI00247A9351|nr:armadillo repeat-containing protein 7-like [Uranotaenia lowii]